MHASLKYVRTFLSFCLPARILAVKSPSTSEFPDLVRHEGIPSVLGVLDAGSGGGGGGGGIPRTLGSGGGGGGRIP